MERSGRSSPASPLHRGIRLDSSPFFFSLLLASSSSRQNISLLQVTGMARQMVINYGMSDIGPWSLLDPSAQSGDVVMRMMARNSMSENLQQRIDDAVKKIAEEAYEVALKHIRENRWVGGGASGVRARCEGVLAVCKGEVGVKKHRPQPQPGLRPMAVGTWRHVDGWVRLGHDQPGCTM